MPSPEGEGGPAGPDEGLVCLSNPFMGNYSKVAPHQSASGAADSFPLGGSQYSGFMLAYTRPTYLLYHKQHVLFNPEYAQILHSKIVGSANRRNTKAVI